MKANSFRSVFASVLKVHIMYCVFTDKRWRQQYIECMFGVADRTFTKKGLTPFSTALVLKGFNSSPELKTQPSEGPSSGLEALLARCEGPTERLLTPSGWTQKTPHFTEGVLTSHRHLGGVGKVERSGGAGGWGGGCVVTAEFQRS